MLNIIELIILRFLSITYFRSYISEKPQIKKALTQIRIKPILKLSWQFEIAGVKKIIFLKGFIKKKKKKQ